MPTYLDFKLSLTSLFAYAPRDIARRNNSTGGDSPLGNVAADSMRKRRRVDAEVAVTNSLGIRDNIYAGPLTQEALFNVFPFENTINIMYLSGVEMEEMFDFISERSAGRGCVSQAQVSGCRFTMDCAQVQLNALRLSCTKASDCPKDDRTGRAPWQCIEARHRPDAIAGGGGQRAGGDQQAACGVFARPHRRALGLDVAEPGCDDRSRKGAADALDQQVG